MNKIIIITGPTGVGKTKLSIAIAKKYNGEIINADAMQIYKDLNIGTAKITEEEKENIPHHLFDIKNITEDYSIYNYQKDCRTKINDIQRKGKIPILVGGTGLYIKSALYDYKIDENNTYNDNTLDNKTLEELKSILKEIDPKSYNAIDINNKRRLISAIKYYKTNNKSIIDNKTNKLLYNCLFIGLTTNRDNLYDIINKRVDIMLRTGLEEEVRSFYNKKIFTKPLLSGIGYKEFYWYFEGKISKEEAINYIKRNSRRYAKRQYTYFKHQLPITWFNTNYKDFNKTITEVSNYIDNNLY